MRKGQIETSRIFTAQILITPTGDAGAIDMGEVQTHKRDIGIGRTEIMRSKPGFRTRVANLIGDRKGQYEVMLEEDFPDTVRLALLGAQGADTAQAAANGLNAGFVATQGRTFDLGKYNVSNVTVTVGAEEMTEGEDYDVNLNTGTVFVIPGGGIANEDNVTVAFDCAAVDLHNFTADEELYTTGAVKIIEMDQHENAPAKITTFTGQYYMDQDQDHDGKKIGNRKLIIIPQTREVVVMRK
jgi:hypothetical protein